MRYILFVATFLILEMNVGVAASENPMDSFADMAVRSVQAKAEGRKMVLALGATPPEQGNFSFSGFDQEPFVVYFNKVHFRDIEHLSCAEAGAEAIAGWTKQFIQGDFNDVSDLEAVQHRFESSFDLITLDFSVSKFMNLAEQHLHCFLRMLTIGGTMVFDYTMGCGILTIKKGSDVVPIASDEEALSVCMAPLDPTNSALVPKFFVRVNWRNALSVESSQLLKEFYAQYVTGWASIHMPPACELYVIDDTVFPYWKPTGHEERDRWIAEPRHYLVMRKLG
ncbi:MAG: hypothetical protein V4482_01520 [Pseudomonadota bacterium]